MEQAKNIAFYKFLDDTFIIGLKKLECLVYNPKFAEVEIVRNKMDFCPHKNLYTYQREIIGLNKPWA